LSYNDSCGGESLWPKGRQDIINRALVMACELPLLKSLSEPLPITDRTIDQVFNRLHGNSTKKITLRLGLQYALSLALFSVIQGGGPFGAIILKQGRILGYGANHVTRHNDPTDHGEVNAIRRAVLNGHERNLFGATLLTSTYPCPMCYGYALDHGIQDIMYINTEAEATQFGGFNDQYFWAQVKKKVQCDAPAHRYFQMFEHRLLPVDFENGEALEVVLRRYCQTHGFEPGLLSLIMDKPRILRLFDYVALHWAGADMSNDSHVVLKSFPMPGHGVVHVPEWSRVGQKILALFNECGTLYGQY
jgi:guanine deaminase